MRKRALLAIVFAGGILSSHAAASAKDGTDSGDSVIKSVADNLQAEPEARAFYLLKIAEQYAFGHPQSDIQKQFANVSSITRQTLPQIKRRETLLGTWAERLSAERGLPYTSCPEAKVLANRAAAEAVKLLAQATNPFAKSNLYLIASYLYEKLGNKAESQKCEKILDVSIRSCEAPYSADEEQIRAATSVLNAKAYGYVPIRISDYYAPSQTTSDKPQNAFNEGDLKIGEKLKLRASAIADQLPATADIRRRSHRDLALWYTEVGQPESAEKEKQILFKLVGKKDDRLLFPTSLGCGHVVWWRPEVGGNSRFCGMG